LLDILVLVNLGEYTHEYSYDEYTVVCIHHSNFWHLIAYCISLKWEKKKL